MRGFISDSEEDEESEALSETVELGKSFFKTLFFAVIAWWIYLFIDLDSAACHTGRPLFFYLQLDNQAV